MPSRLRVGPVAELVGIEGGVVSGVFNLESSVSGAATTRVTRRPYGRYDKAWLSREPNSVLLCPTPRHELVEARCRPEIDELCEHVGEVGLRIDTIQFAGLDK